MNEEIEDFFFEMGVAVLIEEKDDVYEYTFKNKNESFSFRYGKYEGKQIKFSYVIEAINHTLWSYSSADGKIENWDNDHETEEEERKGFNELKNLYHNAEKVFVDVNQFMEIATSYDD